MYLPDISTFRKKTAEGNVIPVYREIPADLETPVSAFLKLRSDQPAFLLESVEKGERTGRYSFLACSAHQVMSTRGDKAVLRRNGVQQEIALGKRDALHVLEEILAGYRAVKCEDLPPFLGGAVGYLSYDMVRFFERLPEVGCDELNLPDCVFLLPDAMIVFDHVRRTMKVVSTVPITESPGQAYDEAVARIDAVAKALERPFPLPETPRGDATKRSEQSGG